MGVAILCLLIGIPLGLVMLCRPKQMWRATQSWKFKNPEANEPSEAGYAVSALGGLVVIIVAIGMASLAWSTAREKKAADEKQRQQQEWDAEVAAYVPPKPESRGALPIIGYIDRPLTNSSRVTYDVYYLHPPNAFDVGMKQMANSRGRYQCVSHAGWTLSDDNSTLQVTAGLSWEPDVPQPDSSASDDCRVGDLTSSGAIDSFTAYVSPGLTVITDSPIVDARGAELKAAAPGNAVPKLIDIPRR